LAKPKRRNTYGIPSLDPITDANNNGDGLAAVGTLIRLPQWIPLHVIAKHYYGVKGCPPNSRAYEKVNIALRDTLKTICPCMDCGRYYDQLGGTQHLEFDHRDPIEKQAQATRRLRAKDDRGRSMRWDWHPDRVLEELAKCDLVCRKCHQKRTDSRKPETLRALRIEEQATQQLDGE